MAIMTSKSLRHEFCMEELKKLGAEVINIQGIMFYVKFKIDHLNIEYLYHIHQDDTYLLERIKPYLLMAGEYPTEEDVVETIKIDIEQFKNAMKSKKFDEFVSIDQDLAKLVRVFEDLYLYYNISKYDLATLKSEINLMLDLIHKIKNNSTRVYHGKNPESFRE